MRTMAMADLIFSRIYVNLFVGVLSRPTWKEVAYPGYKRQPISFGEPEFSSFGTNSLFRSISNDRLISFSVYIGEPLALGGFALYANADEGVPLDLVVSDSELTLLSEDLLQVQPSDLKISEAIARERVFLPKELPALEACFTGLR